MYIVEFVNCNNYIVYLMLITLAPALAYQYIFACIDVAKYDNLIKYAMVITSLIVRAYQYILVFYSLAFH